MNDRRWTAADFDYPLPTELIAQVPTTTRGASRLLVVTPDATDRESPQAFHDAEFPSLTELVQPGDLLVVNSTRVRHARFHATRPSGGPVEVLLIHPGPDDTWIAMGAPGRALRPGRRVRLGDGVAIEVIAVLEDGMRQVRFTGATAADAIARFGRIPLPPYIVREPTPDDERRYQTVYADREGSVAAPTAGLHFTEAMLESLRSRGVRIASLDLEVGPGTFRPMPDGHVTAHAMHSERFYIPAELATAVADARRHGGAIWAVGTTVVRALESAASRTGIPEAGAGETQLMITPGFRFRVVDRLITNFHLPRSTLLMLVAAFAGYRTTMAAYRHAIEQRYRFYSYGDAMCVTGELKAHQSAEP